MRSGSLLAATVAIMTIATVAPAQKKPATPRKQPDAKQEAKARYATVNGLQMYYEIHGKGRTLVLLHGAFSNIDTDFGKLLPTLAKNRRIIAIEQQAHGRTADIDRPLTYEQMADNTAELLRRLDVKNADFLGYSMGGGIATYIAIRHPDLVRKFVFAGGAVHGPEGFYPEVLEGEEKMKPEDFAGTPWLEAYRRIAPNPRNWSRLVDKIRALDLNWKGLRPEEIQLIKAPALLINGDADVVRPEHAVQMFRLLGGGVPGDLVGLPRSQLAILPGTTHVSLIERTDWLLSMVAAFLDAPMPKAN